ncbi:MAG: Gfo/Idh/MocA family protein [Negativicutes bacterium]
MRIAVIGYGSIGSRHVRILNELGHRVAVVSGRSVDYPLKYSNITEAIHKEQPEYIVIANKTIEHGETLSELAGLGFSGLVMVEKPLFHQRTSLPDHLFQGLYVAYNLRFHPLFQRLHSLLQDQKIITAHAYVGQYLPDWRPGQDYREGYSVRKAEGGGVLNDLSHELDYLNWILGGWSSVVAVGGHFSQLAGDSDDAVGLLIAMKKCSLTMIHLNYLDRVLRREVIINTDIHTYAMDLAHGSLQVDGHKETCMMERDDTYRAEHLAVMNGEHTSLCSFSQGRDVVELIHCAEESITTQRWVKR